MATALAGPRRARPPAIRATGRGAPGPSISPGPQGSPGSVASQSAPGSPASQGARGSGGSPGAPGAPVRSWAPEGVPLPASVQGGRVVRAGGAESTQVLGNAPTVPQLAVAAGFAGVAGAARVGAADGAGGVGGAGGAAGAGGAGGAAGAGAVGANASSPPGSSRWAVGEQTRTVPYTRPSKPPAGDGRGDVTQSIRRRPHRARWFVLGIAFGAIGAVILTGDARSTIDGARAWGARALRSLERKAPPQGKSAPTTTATTDPVGTQAAWAHADAPCPMDPSGDDPCAELLAPFANQPAPPGAVPVVRVDDLPKVRPVVVAYARRGRVGVGMGTGAGAGASAGAGAGASAGAGAGAGASTGAGAGPSASAEGGGETADRPIDANPYEDEPQATPARAAPSAAPPPPPPRERTLPDPPSSELPFTASAG